jgi:hypothetical protein
MKQAILLSESSTSSTKTSLQSLTREDWSILEQFVAIGKVMQTAMLDVSFAPALPTHIYFQFEKDNALLSESWLLVMGICSGVARAAAASGGEYADALATHISREILNQYREPIVIKSHLNAR